MKGNPPGLLDTTAAAVDGSGETSDVEGGHTAQLMASNLEALENGQESLTVQLTSANFAELSGREEMTENRLRTSQNCYLLHRAYASKVTGSCD